MEGMPSKTMIIWLGILFAAFDGSLAEPTTTASAGSTGSVIVGAFNMKIFGQTKLKNDEAVDVITKIILRYDLVLLQEIRDSSETAIYTLQDRVNNMTNDPYDMALSPRLGRSSSKEQYAYMYRRSKLQLESTYVYTDPGDRFEREPYIGLFRSDLTAVSRFAVVGIHTRPDDAWTEIDLLVDVYEDLQTRLGIEDTILAGDFNGDCSYVPNYRWEQVRLRTDPRYKWLIEDYTDTTVSSTNCAYDRFVIVGSNIQTAIVPCSAAIFRFDTVYGLSQDQAENVSDHYPIEFTFLPSRFRRGESSLLIGAFNIQIFGETKAGKSHVMDVLARIVKRYDLILIQEIKDASGTAINSLHELSNMDNPDPFALIVSDRLGRSTSKEQYAYFYRPSKIELVATEVYNDTNGDVFQREPYIAHFRSPSTHVQEFIITGIHTKPDEAVTEIDALVDVYAEVQQKYGVEDVILTGDFNADCSYVPKKRWVDIRLRNDPRFCWLINNETDTTVKSTDCAYDRFVIAGQGLIHGVLPYSASTFRFDVEYNLNASEAEEVSDHYPVELQLRKKLSGEEYTETTIKSGDEYTESTIKSGEQSAQTTIQSTPGPTGFATSILLHKNWITMYILLCIVVFSTW